VRAALDTIAYLFQFIVPACFLMGTMILALRETRSAALMTQTRASQTPAWASMSWRDFERWVGETFRQRGFTVTGFGGQGADSGVDLGLKKNGQRFLVQCKHWRNRSVGVTVLRELNGVISAQGAHGGFVVTGGQFTQEAREFAKTCNMELIDGNALSELIDSSSDKGAPPAAMRR
jgi:restriction system protein